MPNLFQLGFLPTAGLFPAFMGLTWLVGKIALKRILRRLGGSQFDIEDAAAFLGVDLSVLSVSLWLGLELHSRYSGTYQQKLMLYVEFGVLLMLSCTAYRFYLWSGKFDGWKKSGITLVSILSGLWSGSLLFVSTIRALLIQPR
jgi:hypothetical protein